MANNPQTKFGKAISKEDAQKCMDGYSAILETFRSEIFPRLGTAQDGPIADAETFYKTKYNAFVFSKDLVTRFFDSNANAQYLMAIMGAHPTNDPSENLAKNTPTVILVGVTMDASGKFTSVQLPLPATEHPPQLVQSVFPLEGQMVFTIE